MKFFVVLCLMIGLFQNIYADVVVDKTSFVNQANYSDKTMYEIKKILLQKAMLDAGSEIYGDFIKSETNIKNGKLIKQAIISEKNGLVRLKGKPIYTNGENFGDIQVTIKAYATQEDLKKMSIQTLHINSFKYTNSSIAIKYIQKAAEDAFLVNAISKVLPSIKNNVQKARKLIVSYDIKTMDFNIDQGTYLMSGSIKYIPYILEKGVE